MDLIFKTTRLLLEHEDNLFCTKKESSDFQIYTQIGRVKLGSCIEPDILAH